METFPKVIYFDSIGNEDGWLSVIENNKQIPFEIKRCYYIYGTKTNVVRGHHAHRNLKQVLICVSGSVDIYCEFFGNKQTYHLDSPRKGLLLEGMIWRNMLNFSADAVLVVLASDYYNEADYIRNYDDFLKLSKK